MAGTSAAILYKNDLKNRSHVRGWRNGRIERAWVPNAVESYTSGVLLNNRLSGGKNPDV